MRFKPGDVIRRDHEPDDLRIEITKVYEQRYDTIWRFSNETTRRNSESEFPNFWILDETCKVKQIMEYYD